MCVRLINYVLICICGCSKSWKASNTALHILARYPLPLLPFFVCFSSCMAHIVAAGNICPSVTQARTVFVVDTRQGTGRDYLQSRLPLAIQEADKIAISISFSCVYLEAYKTARISSAETIYHIPVMENNCCCVTVMHRRSDVISCCCAKK